MISIRKWTLVIAAWVLACPSGQASETERTHSASATPDNPSASSGLPLEQRAVPWRQTPAMEVIRAAWENARLTTYDSITRVDESSGDYHFDCSGFVQWVLRQSHPVAARWVASGLPHRPLARNFYSRIASIPAGRPRWGWQRVERVADILPGDVIAWIKMSRPTIRGSGLGPSPWSRIRRPARLWSTAGSRRSGVRSRRASPSVDP